MLPHRHDPPRPDCFGCKVSGVGFQSLRSAQGADPVQLTSVVGDDGARAGQQVGRSVEHWDGRVDATVFAPKLTIETKARET